MPIGAFAASHNLMNQLTFNPTLGHITTFGGHPVSCAAARASLSVILEEKLAEKSVAKGKMFVDTLKHHTIKQIRGKGLFLAVDLIEEIDIFELMTVAMTQGIMIDPFLFRPNAFRIAPPLTITESEIKEACKKIVKTLDIISNKISRSN